MHRLVFAIFCAALTAKAASLTTASNNFTVNLSPPGACVFTDDAKSEDTIVAWANKPFAYARINNTEAGLTQYDVYGTKRVVTFNKQRTGANPFPFGESPIYIVGPKGLKVNVRPDPGW